MAVAVCLAAAAACGIAPATAGRDASTLVIDNTNYPSTLDPGQQYDTDSYPIEQVFADPRHPYTQLLLAAAPRPRVQHDKVAATVRSIGELPSPRARPSGCAFSSRCPLATDRCHQETRALRVLTQGRSAAWHHAETAQVGAA